MPDTKSFAYFEIKQNRNLNTKNYNKTHDYYLMRIKNRDFFGCGYFATWPLRKSVFVCNKYIREKNKIKGIDNFTMSHLFKQR